MLDTFCKVKWHWQHFFSFWIILDKIGLEFVEAIAGLWMIIVTTNGIAIIFCHVMYFVTQASLHNFQGMAVASTYILQKHSLSQITYSLPLFYNVRQ